MPVKIGRFGPIVQIGSASDDEKPRFAQMKPGQTLETITLEEALGLFSLPRTLGEYEGATVTIGAGRFGPYIKHGGNNYRIPKGTDATSLTEEKCKEIISSSEPTGRKKRRK